MKIEENNWGIANTINGKIYLNKHLQEFPELRLKIIKHEFEHKQAKGFLNQRKIDALTEIKFSDMWYFIKKYPKHAIQQYLPISYINGTLYFEWTLILLTLLVIGILFGIYKLIDVFSSNSILFWKIIKNIFIIGFIAIVLSILGKRATKYVNKKAKEYTK